jgi:hypothetical protein
VEYADGYLREFLPRDDPPAAFVPPEVEEEIAAWRERARVEDGALLARCTRWTYAMFQELRLRQIQIELARGSIVWTGIDPRVAIGLFDPKEEEPGFGLCLLVPPSSLPLFHVMAVVAFPRLEARFVLGARQAVEEDHAPIHPRNATSAAWARCNRTSLWGILTAGHAVGGRKAGRPVPLAGGGTGSLLRSFHPPIDAAFVHTAAPSPLPSLLAIQQFPAAGHPVSVELQSGPVGRTVFRVMDSLGVVDTRSFPVLMFTDRPCAAGDSGALVRAATGEAVGLNLGDFKNPQTPGGVAGRVLNFEQATLALDVTAHL